ncbi:hypothetical protein FB639_003290 [Coemansia asiatica]|nr:hypothetical protein FB639_003290 [Coemansia asiatica]
MQLHGIGYLTVFVAVQQCGIMAIPAYQPVLQYINTNSQPLGLAPVQAQLAVPGLAQQNIVSPEIQLLPAGPAGPAAAQIPAAVGYTNLKPPSLLAAPVLAAPAVNSPVVDTNDIDDTIINAKPVQKGPVIPFQRRPGISRLPSAESDPPVLNKQPEGDNAVSDIDSWPFPVASDSSSDALLLPSSIEAADDQTEETIAGSSSIAVVPETTVASTTVSPPMRKRPAETKKHTTVQKPLKTTAPSIAQATSAAANTLAFASAKISASVQPTASLVAAVSETTASRALPNKVANPPNEYSSSAAQQPMSGAAGAIRVACNDCHRGAAGAVPAQNVTGDMRQNPGSGMGYHGHRIVRGVNIGGFLVPEFWITPSLISSIPDPKPNDYLQLCNRLGPDATLQLMRKHWETWVSEPEVQRLANSGLTHIRIPIGHWEFVDSDEGYVRGGLPYFKRLVYWARKYGLRVIPDMHTAPGSQNGFDNSGSTNGINWTKDPRNVDISKKALQNMLRYIASDPVILETVDAIDLLNEPFIDSLDFNQLWDYDTGGHTLISNGLKKVPPVVSIIDRGFKEFTWWQTRWPQDWNNKYIDAFLDAHLYHVFDRNIDNWPLENHLRLVCQNGRDLKTNSTHFPIIVGEWSLALPQPALQGRENEARRRFAEAQLDAYELGGAGWIFWCFKTEVSPEWSFLEALDRSWIPQPLTSREFPPVCQL